jgi:hypothetical protein
MFLDLGSSCPRLDKYETLFTEYDRVRDSISIFYALIIAFCQKAIVVMQRSGKCVFHYDLTAKTHHFILQG